MFAKQGLPVDMHQGLPRLDVNPDQKEQALSTIEHQIPDQPDMQAATTCQQVSRLPQDA